MSDAVDLLVLMCVGQCVLVLVLTFLSILCVAHHFSELHPWCVQLEDCKC